MKSAGREGPPDASLKQGEIACTLISADVPAADGSGFSPLVTRSL